jgi:hypothetical protein
MLRGLVVVLTLGLIPLTGLGQEFRGRGGPDEVWKALAGKHDADGDGRIDRDEYPRGEERFRALDHNRDGVLSVEDFRGTAGRGGPARKKPKPTTAVVAPRVGEKAPDFELPSAKEETKTVRLSSFAGKRPVALVFGNYT